MGKEKGENSGGTLSWCYSYVCADLEKWAIAARAWQVILLAEQMTLCDNANSNQLHLTATVPSHRSFASSPSIFIEQL
jgi:hypothetical protein